MEQTGQSRIEEITALKVYFQRRFPELTATSDWSDATIQRQLLALASSDSSEQPLNLNHPASLCLRCFISYHIYQSCTQLAAKFGASYGFNRNDLLPYVLQDYFSGRAERPAQSDQEVQTWALTLPVITGGLCQEILHTFDPERGSLATWTGRRMRQHRELNQFLLEHGVYLISDWAILNDTTLAQVGRILAEFHQLPAVPIQRCQQLLEQYHRVYRQAQLQTRRAGGRGLCPRPTPQQLEQIAQQLQWPGRLSGQQVLLRLQDLAELLRQYRIYVRGGLFPQDSLDDPALSRQVSELPAPSLDDEEQAQQDFVAFYQQQLTQSLDRAIARVIDQRLVQLQHKQPTLAWRFLQGLELCHCQGLPMANIASLIELNAQYQVTRLLKLKALRADVRRTMLVELRRAVMAAARSYTTAKNLEQLDRQIAAALDEQTASLVAAAELEGSRPRGQPLTNLFARRLCEHLKTLKPFRP